MLAFSSFSKCFCLLVVVCVYQQSGEICVGDAEVSAGQSRRSNRWHWWLDQLHLRDACHCLSRRLQVSVLLRRCQTNDIVGQFRLPIKSANKNLSFVMQSWPDLSTTIIVWFHCPTSIRSILDEKIAQLLCSYTLSELAQLKLSQKVKSPSVA